MQNESFPHKNALEEALATMRNAADVVQAMLVKLKGRIPASMTTAEDAEICYNELWLRQMRDRIKELDSGIGEVRQMNWKRALHLWYTREENVKLYGHTFRLDFHMIPSLPKERTKERAELIEWLKAGQRMDCLVMDEGSGEWSFDFKKMEQLVNVMLSEGNRPPASIKLHPQAKIEVRASKG